MLPDVEFKEVVLMYLFTFTPRINLETIGRSYFDNVDVSTCGISGSQSMSESEN